MTYKGFFVLLVIGGAVVGANFIANAAVDNNVAHRTVIWEGECQNSGLINSDGDVALSLNCEGTAITTKSAEVLLYHYSNREVLIRCTIYEAGNSHCEAGENSPTG